MTRRALACLLSLGCLMVAATACTREVTPMSSGPPAPPPTAAASPQLEASPTTSPTPTATSTTSPAASPTATATSKPSLAASPTPTATSIPRPTPSRSPPAAGTPAPERTPTPTQEPVAIESTPLTLGAPRELPTGWALYYGDHHCEGVYDTFRVADTRDGDTLGVERPWAFFDEQPGYTYSFSVSRGGQTLAVLACERGVSASRATRRRARTPSSPSGFRGMTVSCGRGKAMPHRVRGFQRWPRTTSPSRSGLPIRTSARNSEHGGSMPSTRSRPRAAFIPPL